MSHLITTWEASYICMECKLYKRIYYQRFFLLFLGLAFAYILVFILQS